MSAAVMTTTTDGHASVSHDGFDVISNSGTPDELRGELQIPANPDPNADTPADDEPPQPATTDGQPQPERLTAREKHDRIQRLTWEKEQAKREADEAKQETQRLRDEAGRFKASEPAPAAPKQPEWQRYKAHPDAPKEDDFESYADYTAALSTFIADQRFEDRLQATRQSVERESRQQADQRIHAEFSARLTAAMEADPTLADVLGAADVAIHAVGPMPHVLKTSPVGVQMMRYLAEHPEAAAKLVDMATFDAQGRCVRGHPMDLYAELRILERSLTSPAAGAASPGSARAAKPSTKAEPPIKPVVGSPVAVSSDPPGDDASDEEYFRYWDNPANRKKHGVR